MVSSDNIQINGPTSTPSNNDDAKKAGPVGAPAPDAFSKIMAKERRTGGKKSSSDEENSGKAAAPKTFEEAEDAAEADLDEDGGNSQQQSMSLFNLPAKNGALAGGGKNVSSNSKLTVEENSKKGGIPVFKAKTSEDKSIKNNDTPKKLQSPLTAFREVAKSDDDQCSEMALKKDKNSTSQFSQERSALAAIDSINSSKIVNPLTEIQVDIKNKPIPMTSDLREIVDQIIDKLYTVKVDGQTDTTIVLKNPPLFEGASVVLSEFDTARGEFNIAFQNLTQAAKQVLDMQSNQNSLRSALEKEGYVVHIVTTTTLVENVVPTYEDPNASREDQSQQQKNKKQQQNQDDET